MPEKDKKKSALLRLAEARIEIQDSLLRTKTGVYGSKFTSLDSVYDNVNKTLLSKGLIFLKSSKVSHDVTLKVFKIVDIETSEVIHHGEALDKHLIPSKDENQLHGYGKSVTFIRRYDVLDFLSLCPQNEDKDGNTESQMRKMKTNQTATSSMFPS